MGLGNFDMAQFKPKRSETAASLLTVTPQQTEKKTERFELRIRSDVLLLFKEICEQNGTDASKVIRAFMDGVAASGSINSETALFQTSVQNVRTEQPIERLSGGNAAGGKVNLRNKAEREQWLKDYKTWGVWLDIPELQMKYYRYDFINGSSLIISVGNYYFDGYDGLHACKEIRYCLLDDKRREFDCCGISMTMVIEWLTQHAKEI